GERKMRMTRGLGLVGAMFIVALALTPRSGDAAKPVPPPSGLIAGAAFRCTPQAVQAGQAILFSPSLSGVNFGSSITSPATPPFSSFTLQPSVSGPGIYQIHLSGDITAQINAVLGPSGTQAIWFVGSGGVFIGGDRLITVSGANTTLSLVALNGPAN